MDFEHEDDVARDIARDLETFETLGLLFRQDSSHTHRWNRRFSDALQRFPIEQGRVDSIRLEQFFREVKLVGDNPKNDLNSLPARLRLSGAANGERALAEKCLKILEDHGFTDLLRKYPIPAVGNPYTYEHRGFRFTHRWFKHIYALGQTNKYIRLRLDKKFVALDIGSAHGAFQYLLHREYPDCTLVLVDLPEQLLLARYYLGTCFPDAKIAGITELSQLSSIDRPFVEEFDFVLVPASWYKNLESETVDLVTSFACLGELKQEFFNYYIQAPVFQSAKYFYTINPVTAKSFSFEDSAVSILDFPIWTPGGKLYFGLCPAYFHSYDSPKPRLKVLYTFRKFPPFFEFIGLLSGEAGD